MKKLTAADKLITIVENEKYLNKPWEEIDEDQWDEWLEVLPPEKWLTVDGVNIFRISERLTGNITMHCARYNDRYFTAHRRTTDSYNFIAAQIKIICKSFPVQKKGGGGKMTIHNKKTDLTCLSCLESGGCIVADTFFENDNLVVLIKCNCGGVPSYEFKAWGAKYISWKRKKLYQETKKGGIIL